MASPALFATILTMDAAGPVDAALLVREVRIGAVGGAADLALLRPEDPRTLVAGR
jgi:predicted amidohydrolase YtcJ